MLRFGRKKVLFYPVGRSWRTRFAWRAADMQQRADNDLLGEKYQLFSRSFVTRCGSFSARGVRLHERSQLRKNKFYQICFSKIKLQPNCQKKRFADQTFLVFKPSLITASCVAASRICLHISPTWTIELRKTTTFAWHHLVPCINILLR